MLDWGDSNRRRSAQKEEGKERLGKGLKGGVRVRVSGIPRQSAQPALSQDLASSNKELEIERTGFPAGWLKQIKEASRGMRINFR